MTTDGLRLQDRVYVLYSDDTHLHERLIMGFGDGDGVVTCTPHLDVYMEHWSEWAELYRSGLRQGVPRKWQTAARQGCYVRFNLAELDGMSETAWGDLQATADRERTSDLQSVATSLVREGGLFERSTKSDGLWVHHPRCWPDHHN